MIIDNPALARRVRETWAEMNLIERFLISVGTKVGVLSISDMAPDLNEI